MAKRNTIKTNAELDIVTAGGLHCKSTEKRKQEYVSSCFKMERSKMTVIYYDNSLKHH